MRSLCAAALLLVLLAVGCGAGTRGATRDERLILAALRRLDDRSRTFVYREEIEDQTVVVKGQVQDDFRYGGSVGINGSDVYSEFVSDDAAGLYVSRPEAAKPLLDAAASVDDVTGRDLAAQRWVMDPSGAPSLSAGASGGPERLVGLNPLFDAVEFSGYAEQAVTEAVEVGRWSPDQIDYNPLDDPWRNDANADLSARGIRRYDITAPRLPLGGQGGRTALPPGPRHFRKMAFYMKGDRIIEIREQISFTDLRDYRRAKDGRAPKAVLETIKAAQEGFTEDPVRERRLTIKVEYEDVSLDIPSDAVPGSLGPALDASGIGKLFKAPATMRTGRGATPVTSPSPAASASPELSPPAS